MYSSQRLFYPEVPKHLSFINDKYGRQLVSDKLIIISTVHNNNVCLHIYLSFNHTSHIIIVIVNFYIHFCQRNAIKVYDKYLHANF